MATVAGPAHEVGTKWTAKRLTRWSLLMLVVLVVWSYGLYVFGNTVLMPALGVSDRWATCCLPAGGAAGWIAEVGMTLLVSAPVVVGVVLAVKAIRRGGRWLAWLALTLNVLWILQIIFSFVDTVNAYYPQGG